MIRWTKVFLIVAALLTLALPRVVGAKDFSSSFEHFVYPEYSKKISMDFKDADLRSVLKIFSQQSNMNFIAASDIANMKITLFIQDVPIEEALERILYANNLIYEIQPGSDIFIVKRIETPGAGLITRVFFLKNATVDSSKLLTTVDDESDSEDSSSDSTTSTSSDSSGDDEETSGLLAAVKSVLTEKGTAIEDPRTNSLVVTDVPSQFPIIEKTIAGLDIPVAQVLIEVEMLDISKNTAELLGVKIGNSPLRFTGATRSHLYPWDQNKILDKEYFTFEDQYTAGTIDATGFTALLQMLKTDTDTKSLANPKILTLNNQTAEIKISTDEAIGVVTSTGGAEGVVTQNVEAERVMTGVSLKVTPQVNILTGEITMALVPSVIEAQTGGTFGGQTFKDPEERGTKSIMRVKDGQTVFLGGLKRTDNDKTITKVPILGDIPLIGQAFRHKNDSKNERELVIFITPRIVSDSATLASISDAAAAAMNQNPRSSDTKRREVEKALQITEQQIRQP